MVCFLFEDEKHLSRICLTASWFFCQDDEARMLVEFATKTRQSVASVDSGDSFEGMSEPVCLRHMLSYCNARSRGVELKKALALCIVGQLPARDREVANELAINAMGIA